MEMVTWNHDGYFIRHGHDYVHACPRIINLPDSDKPFDKACAILPAPMKPILVFEFTISTIFRNNKL